MRKPGPEVINFFSCSTQLKYVMLVNVKMPTIVGMILTFICMIHITSESMKARKDFIFQQFSLMSSWNLMHSRVEHEKCFITSWPFFPAYKLLKDITEYVKLRLSVFRDFWKLILK